MGRSVERQRQMHEKMETNISGDISLAQTHTELEKSGPLVDGNQIKAIEKKRESNE